jgi:2-polyprenyl-3-methyl-5-hydroxy-6-metoxy-1,4-benzoquinol methylase
MVNNIQNIKCLCGCEITNTVFTYDKPPSSEVNFKFIEGINYHREILQCKVCGHFLSVHDMDMTGLYEDDYVSSNYGDSGILKTFNKINALDPNKSDNIGRVKCVCAYAKEHFADNSHHSVLDIGSGLCVFLYRMKEFGWDCTALDPDPRAVRHAREAVQVKAFCGDFLKMNDFGMYDVITFNRVLEHIENPVDLLNKSKQFLNSNGFVYVELPDGETASVDGKEREEFTIDHIHVFSEKSFKKLIQLAGFTLKKIERKKEPSSKYSIRAFMVPCKK